MLNYQRVYNCLKIGHSKISCFIGSSCPTQGDTWSHGHIPSDDCLQVFVSFGHKTGPALWDGLGRDRACTFVKGFRMQKHRKHAKTCSAYLFRGLVCTTLGNLGSPMVDLDPGLLDKFKHEAIVLKKRRIRTQIVGLAQTYLLVI